MADKKKKSSAKAVSDTQKIINELKKMSVDNTKLMQKYNSKEAAMAREFNSQEAATARDWEEYMSNTSHQREVADLKAAGLNPVLSANSGATAYSTSTASGQAANSGVDSALGSISGIVSSLFGAEATKAASAQSASATKYAADQNLKAAQEAASAARYSADVHYRTEMDKPQSSWAALADKYFGHLFGYGKDNSIVQTVSNGITKTIGPGILNSYASFKKYISADSSSLLGKWLVSNGYQDTWKNKGLWLMSLTTGDDSYKNQMLRSKSNSSNGRGQYS